MTTGAILDNPIWHALTGPMARWAVREGKAVRFAPDAAPFFALEAVSAESLRDLAHLVRRTPGTPMILPRHVPTPATAEARLFLEEAIATPAGWVKTFEKPLLQMWLQEHAVRQVPDVVDLSRDDATDIVELARRAEPGPFGPRTPEIGAFVGIRRGGRLVAMAGERIRLPGFVEISAIATDPEHRGRGYGAAVTAALAARIRDAGAVPFLHVFAANPAASLYRRLGFSERRQLVVTWLRLAG